MTEGFQELGLGAELVSTLQRLGYARPTALQRAAIPVLRRGANAVIHAASGAGATAAYGLALAERLRDSDAAAGIQALVVTPTEERASAVGLELGLLAHPAGIRAGVPAPGWQGGSSIVVAAMPRVPELLQSSTLKLDDLKVLVLHDLSSMVALNQEEALETLLTAVPRDAQRIVITSELTPATEKLAEAHVRKAMHIPARPALRDGAASAEAEGTIDYQILRGAPARQAVAEAISAAGKRAAVFCRRQSDCDRLQEELSLRGLQAETRLYGAALLSGEAAVGFGAPLDAETLSNAFPEGGTIILDASQLTHLRNITRQANLALRSARPGAGLELPGLEQFRASLRRALQEEDVEAQLLVLEPLLAEFSAAEVAAAATALLRKRTPVPAETSARTGPAPSAAPPAFVKLFLSVGQRDAVAAREIVGAITGEAGVSGDQVGRVEVRDTFSIVDVASDVAERVIRALNGTSLRGRSVRVDYDRKGGPPRRSLPARRSHPRQ